GGLNSPQFSTMDLDGDAIEDLVVFERTNNRVLTFLAAYRGKSLYVHAPAYETMFPAMSSWALLVDYNHDGKKDIFTYSYLGLTVYKNTSVTSGVLTWKKVAQPLLSKFSTYYTQVYTNVTDIPAISDIDNDGDYDILDYNFFNGTNIEIHKNLSMETFGNSDSLMYKDTDQCWAGISENYCNYTFGSNCPVTRNAAPDQITHVGASFLALIDADGDGDKDVFSGKENCTNLYELPNKGTASSPLVNSYTTFPSSNPISFEGIPGVYQEDIDFDGWKDLIASPTVFTNSSNSVFNNVDFKNSARFYKNTGTDLSPVFTYTKSNFLQENMIELGENAAPAFADYDADGDLDMLVGNRGLIHGGSFYATLSLYENTGTPLQAQFTLANSDYLNLSSKGYTYIRPQFSDLNGDNAMDLIFACYNTSNTSGGYSIKYMLNSNPSGTTFAFNTNSIGIVSISTQEDNPFFYDMDADGDKDLLIGRAQGNLSFYRNTGNASSPVYTLVTDTLGGIHVDNNHMKTWLSVTVQDIDSDAKPDLITGDNTGALNAYPDFLSNLSSIFTRKIIYRDSSLSYYNMGKYLYLSSADLNGDNIEELMVGNNTGGLNPLKRTPGYLSILSLISPSLKKEITVSLAPNPASEEVSLMAGENCTAIITDLLGNFTGQKIDLKKDIPEKLSTSTLPDGFYVVKFTSADYKTSVQKLIIRK
ncbi:MAG: FG-GAP-like repeat-containing protein, partial [Cytophagaceae bacterium]